MTTKNNAVSRLDFLGSLVLVGAIVLGNAPCAIAGDMHARASIGLYSCSQLVSHNGVAHCRQERPGGRYRVAHEELGNNYTYGNAGSGHAHHHPGSPRHSGGGEQDNSNRRKPAIAPPVPGSRGTSQYVKQTWLPNASVDKIEITWTSDSFLQVDPSELTPRSRLVSRASLTASGAGLAGTVELSARLDEKRMPQIETQFTGIFKGLKFELVSHPGGIVSLHFRQPLSWTVQGNAETFDIALDASIEVEQKQRKSDAQLRKSESVE